MNNQAVDTTSPTCDKATEELGAARNAIAQLVKENIGSTTWREHCAQSMVDLLEAHPSLLLEKIVVDPSYIQHQFVTSFYPLTLLLLADLEEKVLVQLLGLYTNEPIQKVTLEALALIKEGLLAVGWLKRSISDRTILFIMSKGNDLVTDYDGEPEDICYVFPRAVFKNRYITDSPLSLELVKAMLNIRKHPDILQGLLWLDPNEECLRLVASRIKRNKSLHLDLRRLNCYPHANGYGGEHLRLWETEELAGLVVTVERSKYVAGLLPHLKHFGISGAITWTISGWTHLMQAVTESTTLKSLSIVLPSNNGASIDAGVFESLEDFFQFKPPQLSKISISPERSLGDDRNTRRDNKWIQSIVAGIKARRAGLLPVCKELFLGCFENIEYDSLAHIGQCVRHLECGEISFKQAGTSPLDEMKVQLAYQRGVELWRLIPEIQNDHSWDRFEAEHSFAPPSGRVSTFNPKRAGQLTHISIEASEIFEDISLFGRVDLTNFIVAALQVPSLTSFSFTSSFTYEHQLDVVSVFGALKKNKKLEKLELIETSFVGCDKAAIPILMSNSVQGHKSLKEFRAVQGHIAFAYSPYSDDEDWESQHGKHSFMDFHCSTKIQQVCWMNHYGCELRKTSVTRGDFVRVILCFQHRLGKTGWELRSLLSALCTNSSGEQLGCRDRFYTLMQFVDYWCYRPTDQYHANILSVIFGLLYVAPEVWSSASGYSNACPALPVSKKRKVHDLGWASQA